MSDRTIPDQDHLSRYCKPSTVDDGLPTASAFELRPGEDHLSVNWLEYLGAPDIATAIHLVRGAFHDKAYRLRRGGRFAVFQCGIARFAVGDGTGRPLRIEHLPLDHDPSHAGVFGYAVDDFEIAVELAAIVNREDVHPAVT